MENQFIITAFYHFTDISDALEKLKSELYLIAEENILSGLIIVAPEGCNGTIAGPKHGIEKFQQELPKLLKVDSVNFKNSRSSHNPFRRFKVKTRPEIVTIGDPNIIPNGKNNHLTPKEWDQVIESEEDYVLLDTRNWYETEVGIFKNALDPNISTFQEFPEFVANSGIPKDKKVLMYCTGGIRCEKALIEMQRQGYENVYQLDGGILKYFEESPHKHFDGECFVFDHRVAVDQELQPSRKFDLCCHCGQPAAEKISCLHCKSDAIICSQCKEIEHRNTCSKNCAHHHQIGTKNRKLRPVLFENEQTF